MVKNDPPRQVPPGRFYPFCKIIVENVQGPDHEISWKNVFFILRIKNLKNDRKREKHQNYMFEMSNGTLITSKRAEKHEKARSRTFKNGQKWPKMTHFSCFFTSQFLKNGRLHWGLQKMVFFVFFVKNISLVGGPPHFWPLKNVKTDPSDLFLDPFLTKPERSYMCF